MLGLQFKDKRFYSSLILVNQYIFLDTKAWIFLKSRVWGLISQKWLRGWLLTGMLLRSIVPTGFFSFYIQVDNIWAKHVATGGVGGVRTPPHFHLGGSDPPKIWEILKRAFFEFKDTNIKSDLWFTIWIKIMFHWPVPETSFYKE